MNDTAKLIEVLDARSGATRTTEFPQSGALPARVFESLAPYPRDARGRMTVNPDLLDAKMTEAATGEVSTANFPDLLRLGVQFDLLAGFMAMTTVYERLVRMKPSSKQQEEYQDDAGIGLPPIVTEGMSYPESTLAVGGGKIIRNYKRGNIIKVTEEMMRFDQTGKIRETAEMMGRAHRLGREQAVMDVITTTTKYNVLNNNDQAGNNTQTLTFSPVSLNTAIALMMTQRDKQSGSILGVVPQILLIGPLLERFARNLISSTSVQRVGGNTTNDVYGTGTGNPFFGIVNQIIVSPQFGASYQWALIDPSRFLYFQEVEPLQVLVEGGTMQNESWVTRDLIRYKSRDWYGVDIRDDRYGFYSDSTTAPLAA